MRSVSTTAVQASPSARGASSDDAPSFIEAARRAQIIECAIEAIAEVGFARATLAEIAKRAKVSKGVILYYFDGKDDLIRNVVESIYVIGSEYMLPLLQQQPTVRDTLRAYIESNIAYMAERRTYIIALVEIFSGFRDRGGVSKLDLDGHDYMNEHLIELLRSGQRSGEFRDFDAGAMAFAIRASIDMLPPTLARDAAFDVEGYVQELIEIFDLATTKSGSKDTQRHRGSKRSA